MNYWGQPYGEKHYCERPNCQQPSKLASNQCKHQLPSDNWPIPTCELKSEFVVATKKEIAQQQHLPEHFKLKLFYGYPPGRLRDTPENYWSNSSSHWSSSASARNDCQPVLGYYKYTLVKQPRHSSGSGGKLFWLTVIGAAVWLWFVR
ncbi:hypothetical protein [Microcoleus sp. herbarium5]|uniref:hypothetical protein n=1 Tax=Microcoleus sp. herbarium5 TaxID=3055434 RepID=UPI002FD30526